ncbi:uncharacterized protein EHS24_005897 [Apiotrichum porosum]|uniref:LysM domain-containing protein n=1 Tax=Apiotrichum porosum TaxID=105984 RepID=A0A427XZW2_9TREE|nr:uncharacterized protein EHS24_005897 [Apiotrichum porosum]RSH84377.1 hypothetical protein EHS24_005897 [Apiotrichum porosum]
MFAQLALLALPLLAAVKADVTDCSRSATVVDGDTCDAISATYGVSTFQLALVNDATIDENCENLQIDQVVCLGVEGQDCTKVYTVVEDDTCEGIISMYGMSNDTLYNNNPQIDSDCTNIYIGEVLCVDTTAYDYPEFNSTLYQSVSDTYLPWCDEL